MKHIPSRLAVATALSFAVVANPAFAETSAEAESDPNDPHDVWHYENFPKWRALYKEGDLTLVETGIHIIKEYEKKFGPACLDEYGMPTAFTFVMLEARLEGLDGPRPKLKPRPEE